MKNTNTYFEELEKIGHDFEEKRAAHEAKKQTIIDTFGWDSPELKTWYEEKEAMKFPFGNGACKAYRAWKNSIRKNEDEVEMEDFCWEREVEDFLNALREAGIETFVYTNQSTAVMEILHAFAAHGCTMTGLCTITRMENRYGIEEKEQIQGIRFSLD